MPGLVFQGLHWIQSRVWFMGSQLAWARIPQELRVWDEPEMTASWISWRWTVKESESELGQQVQGDESGTRNMSPSQRLKNRERDTVKE